MLAISSAPDTRLLHRTLVNMIYMWSVKPSSSDNPDNYGEQQQHINAALALPKRAAGSSLTNVGRSTHMRLVVDDMAAGTARKQRCCIPVQLQALCRNVAACMHSHLFQTSRAAGHALVAIVWHQPRQTHPTAPCVPWPAEAHVAHLLVALAAMNLLHVPCIEDTRHCSMPVVWLEHEVVMKGVMCTRAVPSHAKYPWRGQNAVRLRINLLEWPVLGPAPPCRQQAQHLPDKHNCQGKLEIGGPTICTITLCKQNVAAEQESAFYHKQWLHEQVWSARTNGGCAALCCSGHGIWNNPFKP
jgi:hypothetical protein